VLTLRQLSYSAGKPLTPFKICSQPILDDSEIEAHRPRVRGGECAKEEGVVSAGTRCRRDESLNGVREACSYDNYSLNEREGLGTRFELNRSQYKVRRSGEEGHNGKGARHLVGGGMGVEKYEYWQTPIGMIGSVAGLGLDLAYPEGFQLRASLVARWHNLLQRRVTG
jgi:hypothetical protein